ncbi:FAD dependent oxidoreductase [Ilyonectria robusta]
MCLFQRHSGMARIFTAAPGLVKLMGGTSWADTQLPEVYQITPSRIRQLKQRTKTESSDLPRL